jgi:hypothetical protein
MRVEFRVFVKSLEAGKSDLGFWGLLGGYFKFFRGHFSHSKLRI